MKVLDKDGNDIFARKVENTKGDADDSFVVEGIGKVETMEEECRRLNQGVPEGFSENFYRNSLTGKAKQYEQDNQQRIKRLKVCHVGCKKYLSFFTRYFFKNQYNKKFIMGDHHKQICALLERVLAGEVTKCIINIPPRYGKTELAVKNFIAHGLALNPSAKFIHLSYSKSLALDNSDAVREIIKHKQFRELFPDVLIKAKSDAKEKWVTSAGGGVYATATGGQVTGFGAGEVEDEEVENDGELDLEAFDFLDDQFANVGDSDVYGEKANFAGALIIDDPIKPEDADSELVRNRVNERFDSTIRNRVNSRRTPIIIIMQRLHEDDLCGHILKGEDSAEWTVLSLPALIDEGTDHERALWEHKHDVEELHRQEKLNKVVFQRQMQQKPMPKEGLMYDTFRLYSVLPVTVKSLKKAYIDIADEGDDFLCEIDYIENEEGMYVTNVYYTDEAIGTTQATAARNITMHQLQVVRIEANNGGKGWKDTVERGCRLLKNLKTKFICFTQSGNKAVRIFQWSGIVTNMIYMPIGWEKLWPKFHKDVTQYSKTAKNLHDDAPDCLTGMCEWFGKDRLMENKNWTSGMK
ncbi:MAG: phage terminase large subunit [Bacteroidota bacterium]